MSEMRKGKTKRDKESGSWSSRFANRELRASWDKNGGKFPYEACNGKKNRLKG